MPITPTNPFKGRQYPGEVILLAVRWYLRYPLAYLHVAEILSERGLSIDASCIWRWVQLRHLLSRYAGPSVASSGPVFPHYDDWFLRGAR